ncbi:extracellular solute-binding protein [Planosporangium thailandense]|uniref:Extracellular solute-binding protein n=1 Tax=Planosporangium thailandense TaxID=765197 RepID=A0ABX0YA01_9ACTN|nr:extracellular solute-binding protein [Planosporangium thailandense]NJC74074.1 extracellular solute-binding protein [Planosporangium thailandense]
MNPNHTNRRNFLKLALAGGGALAVPGLLSACAASNTSSGGGATSASSKGAFTLPSDINAKWPKLSSTEVVLAGFGGETYQVRHQRVFDQFSKLSGAKVVDAPWDYGKFLNMVDSASPEWDAIDFDGYSTVALIQSGKAPAKLADWVRRCDLVDQAYQDYAAGSYAYSVVLGWSSSLKEAPKNWADFFDTKKFPGKRAFPKSIYAGTVEIALMADGVSKDNLYPLDFDRAFRKLDQIKGDLVFYDSYAQGQQYIVQGSATMVAIANSRMIQLKKDGKGDFTYEQAVLYPWGAFPITKNAKHADAVNALIDTMSHPAVQAEVARSLYLGPTVSAAFDLLSADEKALQPNSDENKAKAAVVNTEVAAKQDGEYVKRFFDWVGK